MSDKMSEPMLVVSLQNMEPDQQESGFDHDEITSTIEVEIMKENVLR